MVEQGGEHDVLFPGERFDAAERYLLAVARWADGAEQQREGDGEGDGGEGQRGGEGILEENPREPLQEGFAGDEQGVAAMGEAGAHLAGRFAAVCAAGARAAGARG